MGDRFEPDVKTVEVTLKEFALEYKGAQTWEDAGVVLENLGGGDEFIDPRTGEVMKITEAIYRDANGELRKGIPYSRYVEEGEPERGYLRVTEEFSVEPFEE